MLVNLRTTAFSSQWLPATCSGRSLPRFLCAVFLSLALLATQQIALAHGFSHFGTTLSEQAARPDKSDPQHPGLHVCMECVTFSGFQAAPPMACMWVPMVAAAVFVTGCTVLPAPTFPAPAAFRSRAPPMLLI